MKEKIIKNTKMVKKISCHSLAIFAAVLITAPASEAVTIDFGTGFSTKARDTRGGVTKLRTEYRRSVARANRVYRDSGTKVVLRMRWFSFFPRYREGSKTLLQVQRDWSANRVGNTGSNMTQSAWANARRLDFQQFIGVAGGAGGWGQQPGNYSTISGYFVNNNIVVSHEFGHNLNAAHSHGLFRAFGPGGRRHTPMSGPVNTRDPRLDRFSHKNNRYKGVRLGDGSHDNSGRIVQRRGTASRVR